MSSPLFKIEIKSNYKIILLFLAVISLYAGIITAMYDPKVGAGMNELAKSMPQLFNAFGMGNPGTTLLDFLNNYLYGFILILIPFIYIIIMCYKLAAKYIDKGSMAYLLSTHYSRTQIIFTQFIVLLLGLVILILYATGLIIVISEIMFPKELEITKFILLNMGLLVLEIFLSALCFMFSCSFDELKYSVGLGAGLGMAFFLLQMMSEVSEDIEFLKYFTPLTLFDADGLIKGETQSFVYLGILLFIAIIFIICFAVRFRKRDLSL